MKVLHIVPSVGPARGGPSRAVLDMVAALRKQSLESEIITTNDNGLGTLEVPLDQWSAYQQVPIRFYPRFSPPINFLREFSFSTGLTAWLWQNLRHYDLLHIHALFSYVPTLAMMLAYHHHLPYITSTHGLLCQWSLRQGSYKKSMYLRLLEQLNLNHASALHCTTQQEQKDIALLELKSPTFVLPLGLEIPPNIVQAHYKLRSYLNLPPSEFLIVFLGRLHYVKGLDFLIPALAQLRSHSFRFLIAGQGTPEYESEIRALVAQLGLQDRTHFFGFVDGELKHLLLQGSDVLVLTSHLESFGLAALEALAAGIPVVVTSGVALAETVQANALGYVVDLEVDAIAQAIEHCILNPAVLKAMGDRARQFVLANYTWDRIATQLIDVYTAILNKQPIPYQFSPAFEPSQKHDRT